MTIHQETAAYFAVDLEGPGVLYRTILSLSRATNPESFGIEVCKRELVGPEDTLEKDLRMIRNRLPRHANGESWILAFLQQIPVLRYILGFGDGTVVLDPCDEILAGAHYLLFTAHINHPNQSGLSTAAYNKDRPRPVPQQRVPASLALVLKAKEMPEGLRSDKAIALDTAQKMIDHAIRYAAFPRPQTGVPESSLGPADSASDEENIYVRLEVDDGGDLIGVRARSVLRSLVGKSRSNSLRVSTIRLLRRLSDLQGFSS